MLEECRKQCDKLIVGVQTDPTIDRPNKNKPIQTLEERLGQVRCISYVDETIVYDSEADLYRLLQTLKPDVRFVGADWKGKPFTGHDLDIPVVFNSRNHNYSSSALRKRVYEAELEKALIKKSVGVV